MSAEITHFQKAIAVDGALAWQMQRRHFAFCHHEPLEMSLQVLLLALNNGRNFALKESCNHR
jgi:hypothetical protein